MTKAQIKAEIENLNKQINHFQYGYQNLDHWISLKKQRSDIDLKMRAAEAVWHKEHREKFLKAQLSLSQAEAEYKRNRNAIEVPETIRKWLFKEYFAGQSLGYGKNEDIARISWLSDDMQYAIISTASTKDWGGIGMVATYPAQHWGVKVFCAPGNKVSPKFEGRLTNDVKTIILGDIDDFRKRFSAKAVK